MELKEWAVLTVWSDMKPSVMKAWLIYSRPIQQSVFFWRVPVVICQHFVAKRSRMYGLGAGSRASYHKNFIAQTTAYHFIFNIKWYAVVCGRWLLLIRRSRQNVLCDLHVLGFLFVQFSWGLGMRIHHCLLIFLAIILDEWSIQSCSDKYQCCSHDDILSCYCIKNIIRGCWRLQMHINPS